MESNKPYNKIKSNESWTEGVWDGMIYGTGAGLAGVGAVHGGYGYYGSQYRGNKLANKSAKIQERLNEFHPTSSKYEKQKQKLGKIEDKVEKQFAYNNGNKKFSGWKGLAAYGGSALVGGLAGGVIDHFNN